MRVRDVPCCATVLTSVAGATVEGMAGWCDMIEIEQREVEIASAQSSMSTRGKGGEMTSR
jgi:hypothetical protein